MVCVRSRDFYMNFGSCNFVSFYSKYYFCRYVLEYFSELPGVGIIKNRLNYVDNKPIVSVINPQGEIMNEDAMEIIFQWGFDAFPFRKMDGDDLFKKWAWFWNLMKKVDINIEDMKRDGYIFIYGGNDPKWIQDFTRAIGNIQKKLKHQECGH